MSYSNVIDELTKAIGSHGIWKLKLRSAILRGSSAIRPEEVKCESSCAFGKWLLGASLDDHLCQTKPYQVIRRLHADFHQAAGTALQYAQEGQQQEALVHLETHVRPCADILIKALSKWKAELQHKERHAA